MNNNFTAVVFMAICLALCGVCVITTMNHKKVIEARHALHPLAPQWPPVHKFEQVPITIEDSTKCHHTILTRQFGFHHSELVESLEGHSLVYWVDPNSGKQSFIHIKPCVGCAKLSKE